MEKVFIAVLAFIAGIIVHKMYQLITKKTPNTNNGVGGAGKPDETNNDNQSN